MNKTRAISYDQVAERVCYDPESGQIRRLTYGGPHRPIGLVMGTVNSAGYIVVGIMRRPILAHRIAFLLMTGKWPEHQIDHINRIKTDNRWINLRQATLAQNNANAVKTRTRDLPTGVKRQGSASFAALISVNGRTVHLGTFPTAESASLVYQEAKRAHHGAFSPF